MVVREIGTLALALIAGCAHINPHLIPGNKLVADFDRDRKPDTMFVQPIADSTSYVIWEVSTSDRPEGQFTFVNGMVTLDSGRYVIINQNPATIVKFSYSKGQFVGEGEIPIGTDGREIH